MIERCERYFRSLDGLIGQAVQRAGTGATVILASDHGFGPTRDVFAVNAWLEQQGYLYWADNESNAPRRSNTDVGFAEMTRHVNALDWSRTLAYAATPSSQGINIVEKVPGSDDPLPEDVRAQISIELAAGLMELRHPETGQPLIQDLWTREQAFVGPFEALGPDLSMVLAEGGTMSILPSETIVARRDQVRGHHRWEGIYLAAGPGIQAGTVGPEMSIVDIAPLVLHRLGLPIPDDMAGRMAPELFEAGELDRHPPVTVHASAPVPALTRSVSVELEPEEQAAVMERLRALGYVE